MEEVELLCSRVAIVDQGQIIAMDTIKNLVDMLGGGLIQLGLRLVAQQMLEKLAALPAVKTATLATPTATSAAEEQAPGPAVVKIEAVNRQQAIVSVIGFLNEQDIQVTSLDILEPILESVFLHLTGKKLRE